MQTDEKHRNKWALGLTTAFFAVIFISFAFYKGFIGFSDNNVIAGKPANQTANVISADLVPSPLSNTKETFTAAFEEVGKQYKQFKESVSAVLVPFITGIEVYERE